MPVPQVKVGPDGSIIVDDSSTLIETTAAKKAKEDLLKTQLVRSFSTCNRSPSLIKVSFGAFVSTDF